jgi:hypothetical protein
VDLRKKITNPEKKSNVKLALIALFVLFLFIVIGKFFNFLGNLSQPLGISSNSFYYSWDTRMSNNVLFVSLKNPEEPLIYLVNFDPKNKQTVILHFSNQIYASLPKDYGTWRLGSVYQLGQEEHPQVGVKLLRMSISSLIGQPVDGVIILGQENDPQKLMENWRQNPISMIQFFTQIKTDLRPLDIFKYLTALSTIRSDKIESIDLSKSSITKSQLLPDSSRVLGVDTIRFDLFIREKMADPLMLEEGQSIAIFNATEHPGLAQEAARIVTNLGGNVIIIGNTQTLIKKSLVTTEDSKTATFERLSETFAPECLKKKCVTNDDKITNSRAQVNVIIGEDYYELWHAR